MKDKKKLFGGGGYESYQPVKQKKYYIILASILLLILVIGGTYAFINLTLTGTKKQVIQAGTLSLELDEDENNLIIENALPMYDEVGMIQEPFTFRLINNGTTGANYKLKLVNTKVLEGVQKCSEIGVTENTSARYIYPDELRQEALAMCQNMYDNIETEDDCENAIIADGAPFNTFEGFMDFFIEQGTFEDTRIVIPSNCLTVEYPEELRQEALTMCQNMYPNIETEADCTNACVADGAPFDNFEGFMDYFIEERILEDTRTVTAYPDNYVEKDPTSLNTEDVKYSITKDGVTTIGLLSDLKDGVIDSGTIGTNPNTIEYEYRMWIDSNVTDNDAISSKSLSFKIDVEISQETEYYEPANQECFTYTTNNYVVKDYQACADYLVDEGEFGDFEEAVKECQKITEGNSSYTADDYLFEEMLYEGIIAEENGATITGYTCTDDVVVIPDTLAVDSTGLHQMTNSKINVPVVAIGEEAFGSYVTGPVNTSGKYFPSFMSMTQISSISKVIIPDTVLHIADYAFYNVDLSEVELSSNLKMIGKGAFYGNQLTSLIMPNTLISISEDAFFGNQLTNVNIPNRIQVIGDRAFEYNELTNITIPDSVISIGEDAFRYNQLTSLVLMDGITEIGGGAFSYNQLMELIIPNSVTYIGYNAFSDNQLKSVVLPNNISDISSEIFHNNQLANITIPDSVTYIGQGAFSDNQLTNIIIPDSVTSIGKSAFSNNQLTSVTFSKNMSSISDYAFYENPLTELKIPSNINYIGEKAFYNNKLTDLTIPSNVTSIGKSAYSDNLLTNIIIENGITSIGESAFENNQISSVTLPGSLTSVGNFAFRNNQLQNMQLSSSITTIGNFAFASNLLTNVTIPSSVTSIGIGTFTGNANLTNIVNKTGKSFDWKYICFYYSGSGNSFITGTVTKGTQTITITSE